MRRLSRQIALLSHDERSWKFLEMSAAFVISMGFSCYIEEWIFKALPGFDYYWTVALVELAIFGIVAAFQRKALGQSGTPRKAPLHFYVAAALCLAMSQSLGKVAYRYLNYATGTIVKSGKLVPTIAVSVFWLRRKVPLAEWFAAGLLVTSAALMALGERAVEVRFNPLGLVISAAQLCFASMQGNLHDHILRDHGATISEAMLYTNAPGAFIILAVVISTGELVQAAEYFSASPVAFALLVVRSATFYAGGLAVTALTKEYGTAAATAVGTARKSLTVLMSFVLFPKPFHVNYVFGIVAFLGADLVYLNLSSAKAAARAALAASKPKSLEDVASDRGSYMRVGKDTAASDTDGAGFEKV